MPLVQLQRVRRLPGGQEIVVFAQDVVIADHREYELAVAPIQRACKGKDFARTVADNAPKYVRTYYPAPEEES